MKRSVSIFSPYYWIRFVVNWRMKRAGLQPKKFENDKYVISYWDNESDKPTVFLIQAFAAECQYTWHKQVRSLHKKYRIVVPNFLYFGGSEMKGEKSYLIEAQVEAIDALAVHLKIDQFIICGISFGGVVAAEYADKYPIKINKLALSNSPLKFDREEDLQSLLDELGLKDKTDLFVPKNYKHLHRLFKMSYYRLPPFPPFVFKSIFNELYTNAEDKNKLVEATSHELRRLRSKDFNINMPVLLLWGSNDRLSPVRIANELKEHIGENAEVHIIPKTAHMSNYEKPRKYNSLLNAFLDT